MARHNESRGDDRHGSSRTRRQFLTGVTAAAALATGTGTAAAGNFGGDNGDYTAPADYPLISTRGQFEADGDRKDGVSPTGYDVQGDWQAHRSGDESALVVFVHGFNVGQPGGRDAAYTCEVGFEQNGAEPFFVGFTWDADLGGGFDLGWNESVDIATANGPKLAQWIVDHLDGGGLPVHVVAHSLGARVALEALADLRRRGRTDAVESLSLIGAAVDDQSVETDQAYGQAIEAATRRCYNYYNREDSVLEWAYGTVEFETAVGDQGVQDSDDAPANYQEWEVTDAVADHNSYYEPGDGCLPSVVAQF